MSRPSIASSRTGASATWTPIPTARSRTASTTCVSCAPFPAWAPASRTGGRSAWSARTRGRTAAITGGHVEVTPNKDIEDFSLEQFYGNGAAPRGRPRLEGRRLHAQWRRRSTSTTMSARNSRAASCNSIRCAKCADMVDSNCADLHDRVDAVALAIRRAWRRSPSRIACRDNIYGTDGDWETYSSPSRDARLKTAFKELRDTAERFVRLYRGARSEAGLQGQGPDRRSHRHLRPQGRAMHDHLHAQRRFALHLRLRGSAQAAVRALLRSLSMRRAALGCDAPASSRPVPTPRPRPPGTRPSRTCATRSTAPMRRRWISRWPN